MNIKALALAAVTTISGVAIAPEAKASGLLDYKHSSLIGAIRQTGINFRINPGECWKRDSYGWYAAYRNEMVICQENKRSVGTPTLWTAEDLDTIRHEAQHLIQDCVDGRRQGRLDSVYQDPIGLAKSTFSNRQIQGILDAYSTQSDHIKVMELEAFAVATLNKPLEQASDIRHYCF